VDLDCKVGAPQFTLHASDTSVCIGDLDNECIHLQHLRRAEFYTNAAPFAVPLDDFDICFCTAHYRFSPFMRVRLHWRLDKTVVKYRIKVRYATKKFSSDTFFEVVRRKKNQKAAKDTWREMLLNNTFKHWKETEEGQCCHCPSSRPAI